LFLCLLSTWNFFSGSTARIDLGHTVYFGLGAYIQAILVLRLGMPFVLALIVTACFGGFMAAILGRILLSLRGGYFSIATLVLLVGMRLLAGTLRPITNGGLGLVVPFNYHVNSYYYAALALLVVIS